MKQSCQKVQEELPKQKVSSGTSRLGVATIPTYFSCGLCLTIISDRDVLSLDALHGARQLRKFGR